jgi:hypothetical protein
MSSDKEIHEVSSKRTYLGEVHYVRPSNSTIIIIRMGHVWRRQTVCC